MPSAAFCVIVSNPFLTLRHTQWGYGEQPQIKFGPRSRQSVGARCSSGRLPCQSAEHGLCLSRRSTGRSSSSKRSQALCGLAAIEASSNSAYAESFVGRNAWAAQK
eukprot:Selendium_serpulae@DN11241_c0_g1_i1.p1